jgi:hypothetical protein
VHRFQNTGTAAAKMILSFSPANIERFFAETLERELDGTEVAIDNIDDVAARYVAAAPRYGLEFVG